MFKSLTHFPRSLTLSSASAGLLLALSTSLLAEPPASLTPAELTELDQASTSQAEQIQKHQSYADKIISDYTKRASDVDKGMMPFLEKHELVALLVQTDPVTPPTPKPPVKPVVPPKKKPDTKKADETIIRVECDGGLYFDSKNGVLAYLKNVRLTEASFHLSCSKELKVFLEKKAPKAAKAGSKVKPKTAPATAKKTPPTAAEAKKVAKAKKKKKDSLSSFGDLERIVARGKVKITRKNEKGELLIATAETASYDAKTGNMILKGGTPRLQQSATQYFQARTADAYILIYKNGSVTTSKTGWDMKLTTKKINP